MKALNLHYLSILFNNLLFICFIHTLQVQTGDGDTDDGASVLGCESFQVNEVPTPYADDDTITEGQDAMGDGISDKSSTQGQRTYEGS